MSASGCRDSGALEDVDPLLVFAAASLADVATEMGSAFEEETGHAVAFSFAGSNTLSRQIEAGAPADLFLSANRELVDRLEAAGRAAPGAAFAFAANTLVVVARTGERYPMIRPRNLLQVDSLALADPSAVPAGIYAKRWLEAEGLWTRLEGRIVPTLDVRAALAAVAAGNVEAGIVYATDVAGDSRVEPIFWPQLSPRDQPRYWAAPVADRQHPALEAFVELLRGERGARILTEHGFEVAS